MRYDIRHLQHLGSIDRVGHYYDIQKKAEDILKEEIGVSWVYLKSLNFEK